MGKAYGKLLIKSLYLTILILSIAFVVGMFLEINWFFEPVFYLPGFILCYILMFTMFAQD
jgi:hypothetical protein